MIEFESVKRMESLKQSIETVTGENYEDLTGAVKGALDGYGQGNTPDKGFIAETWDGDGYVLTGVIKNLDVIPNGYFVCRNDGGYLKRLNHIVFSGVTPTIFSIRSFQHCSNINFEFPHTLTSIGDYGCEYCNGLDLGTLKEGLVSIGVNALMHCNQKGNPNIKIPSTVKTVGKQGFYGCLLQSVMFLGTPDSVDNSAFSSNKTLFDIYVPWAEGTNVGGDAPWGATNATIHYNTTYDKNGNPIVEEV